MVEINQETSQNEVVDSNHELFLSTGDHPNHKLSTHPLEGDNYGHWKRSCEVSLTARNKLGLVKGTCKKPPAGSSLLSHWERCDSMVISWILHSVSKEISESILYCASAHEIRKELALRYGHSQGTRIYQMQKDMNTASQGTLYFRNSFPPQRPQGTFKHQPNQLFCNYCKNPGHTIDRCYKLQNRRNYNDPRGQNDSRGFSETRGYRGKRVAATVQSVPDGVHNSLTNANAHEAGSSQGSGSNYPHFTPEMYGQFLALLNKQTMDSGQAGGSGVSSDDHSSLLAGKTFGLFSV